jgi:hypothetical protein
MLYLKNNIMVLLCIEKSSWLNLETLSNISNIIIAFLTLVLGFYVFVYQKNKDNKSDEETEINRRKNIKLQWFKEIIIQPKIDLVFKFYDQINSIKSKINGNDLNDDEKIEIINFIKKEQSELRKSFLDLVQHINNDLHSELSLNVDKLTDNLTDVISNDEFKLKNKVTYNREIKSKIEYSYSEFLSKIFNYCG